MPQSGVSLGAIPTKPNKACVGKFVGILGHPNAPDQAICGQSSEQK